MRLSSAKHVLPALVVAANLTAPAAAQPDSPALAAARKSGEVKVALASAPPYVVISPSGEATGYTVEIVNLALKNMGLPPLKPVLTDWAAMIPALQARQVDFIAPGFQIDQNRCKVVLFTAPTFVMRHGLYTLPGNPKGLKGYASVVSNPDVKLAVVTGSSQEAYALKVGVKAEQLVRVPDIQAAAATVTGGRAQALAVGEFTIKDPAQRGLNLVPDESAPITGFAAAFRKEDVAFRDELNRQLNLLRSNGAMKDLYATKYGVPNWDTLAKYTKASELEPGCE